MEQDDIQLFDDGDDNEVAAADCWSAAETVAATSCMWDLQRNSQSSFITTYCGQWVSLWSILPRLVV